MAPTRYSSMRSSSNSSSRDSDNGGESEGQSDRSIAKNTMKKKQKHKKIAKRLCKLCKPCKLCKRSLRRMIQKEIAKALSTARPVSTQGNHEAGRGSTSQGQKEKYELHFVEPLPKNLAYTFNKIDVHKILRYANGEKHDVVPLSDLSVELLVLDGKFLGDGEEAWTDEKFQDCIVHGRVEKGPLLKAVEGKKLIVKLNQGHAKTAVSFTDNSSWAGGKKFIIAVRVCENGQTTEKIRPGISGPIRVKDRKGQKIEKHHIPQLKDKVQCLNGIGTEYCKRLGKAKIHTVEEFLQNLVIDHKKLQSILTDGSKEVPNEWNAIVKHANECPRGSKLFSYDVPGHDSVVLIFDSVHELLGVKLQGQYQELRSLSKPYQEDLQKFKAQAFQNRDGFKPDHIMDGDSPRPLNYATTSAFQQASSFSTANLNFSEEPISNSLNYVGAAYIIQTNLVPGPNHFQTLCSEVLVHNTGGLYDQEANIIPVSDTNFRVMQVAECQVAETSQAPQGNTFEDGFHANSFSMRNSVGSALQNEENFNAMENHWAIVRPSPWFKCMKKINAIFQFHKVLRSRREWIEMMKELLHREDCSL